MSLSFLRNTYHKLYSFLSKKISSLLRTEKKEKKSFYSKMLDKNAKKTSMQKRKSVEAKSKSPHKVMRKKSTGTPHKGVLSTDKKREQAPQEKSSEKKHSDKKNTLSKVSVLGKEKISREGKAAATQKKKR